MEKRKPFRLRLEQMHPGVAEMDAIYTFYVIWYGRKMKCVAGEFALSTDDPDVKINGGDVIVPYSVRQSGRDVVIKAVLNDYIYGTEGEDTYTLSFKTAFSEQPSFFDDFNTYDTTVWHEGWEYNYSSPGGRVENGDLVFENQGIISTAYSFSQAFGCFSAKIKCPEPTNHWRTFKAAFWLCSNVLKPETIMFKRNPEVEEKTGRSHGGEIDITEYSGANGDYTNASLHINGWGKYLKSSCEHCLPAPGIRDGYHVFSLVWEPDALYWYYDGKLLRAYDGELIKGAGAEPGGEMVVILHMNTTKRDRWFGKATLPEEKPLEFRADWVKVHALKR